MASLFILIIYAILIAWLGWWAAPIIILDLAIGIGYYIYAARVLRQ